MTSFVFAQPLSTSNSIFLVALLVLAYFVLTGIGGINVGGRSEL